MEKVGAGVANGFCTVSAVAHLYNAIKQKKMINGRWDALDKVICVNISKLFSGSLPINASQMVNRLFLSMKIPVATLAKTYRGEKPNFHQFVGCATEDIIEVSDISAYLSRYLDGNDCAEKLVGNIDRVLGTKALVSETGLLNVQALDRLIHCVELCLPIIDLDVITVTRQCNTLLQLIREAFKSRLGMEYQFDEVDISDILRSSNKVLVIDIFADAFGKEVNDSRNAGTGQKNVKSGKMKSVNSETSDSAGEDLPMISIAAEVFQELLAQVDIPIEAEPLEVNTLGLPPAEYKPSKKRIDHWRRIMTAFT